jgi:peptidoglycan/LPS O-acetylase OafA/YrhL
MTARVDFSRRIPELDGIRGLAILLVLFYHYVICTAQLAPGSALAYAHALAGLTWSGVDLFFVLSGLLIGGILLDARESPTYFGTFYARRFFRIVPLWLVACAGYWIVLLGAPALGGGATGWLLGDPAPWYSYLTFTQNFWMAARNAFGPQWLAVSWSLAVEEQFYLTLPLLIRFVSPHRLRWVLGTAIVATPLLRVLAVSIDPERAGYAVYVLPFTRMDTLLLGVLIALLARNPVSWAAIVARRRWIQVAFWVLLAGVAVFTLQKWTIGTVPMSLVGYTWFGAFYAAIVLLVLSDRDGLAARVFSTRPLMALGGLAYGIYLFHQPVLGILHATMRGQVPRLLNVQDALVTLTAAALTLGLAHFSWRYFEKPLVRRGQTFEYLPARPAARPIPTTLEPVP